MGAITGLTEHSSPLVRSAALCALGKFEPNEKFAPMAVQLLVDEFACVRVEAHNLIGHMGERAASHIESIGKLLHHQNPGVCACAASALSFCGQKGKSHIAALKTLLTSDAEDRSMLMLTVAGLRTKPSAVTRKPACAAVAALGTLGGREEAQTLAQQMTKDDDDEFREQCVVSLGNMGMEAFYLVSQIARMFEDTSVQVVIATCLSLGRIAGQCGSLPKNVTCLLLARLQDMRPQVRVASLEAFAMAGERVVNHMLDFAKLLKDEIWTVRIAAINAVISCGEPGQMCAAEICRMALYDSRSSVRVAACKALPKMGERGEAFAEDLSALIEDPTPQVVIACLEAFQTFNSESTEPILAHLKRKALKSAFKSVQEAGRSFFAS